MEPPIPYIGTKKNWEKELRAIADALPPRAKVLDAYGGSGLVSHFFKQERPDLSVFWNDADNYAAWLPKRDALEKWHGRWKDRRGKELFLLNGPAEQALAKILGADLARRVFPNFCQSDSFDGNGGFRSTFPGEIPDYLRGVKRLSKIWGPEAEIPLHFDLLILDPPYNTAKSLDSTYFGTRRDDPPLSLWAAQRAFSGSTPAICWGRDGWLVDYKGGQKIAEKHVGRGNVPEWCLANPPAIKKYHLDRILKDLR